MEVTPNCSVVIPVYNSQDSIGELVNRLAVVLPGLFGEFEAVLVNDGSRDGSWAAIQELIRRYPWVTGINMMRNYGQHNAILCGIRQARYELIVTMDDDLQHPPEEIHKLLEKQAEGWDVVYGVPGKMPHSWWRNLFSVVIKRSLSLIMGVNIREVAAFRLFRTDLRDAFRLYQNPNVQIDVLLSWGTTRFTAVKVDEMPRPYGRSNYNFTRLFAYTMTVLTAFSTVPLRVTSMVGFLFTLLGLLVFLYVVGVYFLVGSYPGFPFLASLIAIFSGTQLFALGIIGEYLARVFDRSMDRPPYVVRETLQNTPAVDYSPEPLVEAPLP